MKELYLWPVNADEEGTPQQVRKVIDGVRANKIPVVFSESTISDKPARQVAKETGARYGGVLYVDSLTDAKGPAPTLSEAARIQRADHRERVLRPMTLAPTQSRRRGRGRHRHLQQRQRRAARRHVSPRERARICALVGVNGSGKSTLFKAIMGFLKPATRPRAHRRRTDRSGAEAQLGGLCAAGGGGRLDLPGERLGRGDDGPLRLHEFPAHPARRGPARSPRKACAAWRCGTSATGRSASFPAGRRSASSSPARWPSRAA